MAKTSGGFPANLSGAGLTPRSSGLGKSRNSAARVDRTLQTDCPDLFKRARALLIQWDAQISDDELSLELGNIIYPAKLLHKDDEYRELVREFAKSALAASTAIVEVQSRLNEIDPRHMQECFGFMIIFLASRKDIGDSWFAISSERVFDAINVAGALLHEMGYWINYVTDHPNKKRGRGQPPIPYWRETLMLMKMWEKLTGRPVLTAKRKMVAKGGQTEGVQPSTEFIRLCLKMIMPGMTLSNVHTLINRVRKIEAGNKRYSGPRASSST
jgi:hypothetical protein